MMKEYLGDFVYIEDINDMLIFTTNDGVAITNIIYLEQETVVKLVDFLKKKGLTG